MPQQKLNHQLLALKNNSSFRRAVKVLALKLEVEKTKVTAVFFRTVRRLVQNSVQLKVDDSIHCKLMWEIVRQQLKNELLRELTCLDELTGLYNRRSLEQALRKFAKTVRRSHHPQAKSADKKYLYFFMIDIDHFKRINDAFGHSTGDEVLKAVAKVLCTDRQEDVCARYGGEEFAIAILTNSPKIDSALSLANRILNKVANLDLRKIHDELNRVTISIGVSRYKYQYGDNVEEKLKQLKEEADLLLYRAKNAGRNRVMAS